MGSCLGAIIITFLFVSPILAVVAWIGWAISDPTSGGWLVIAIVSTVAGILMAMRFVTEFKKTGSQ
ncbi:hypothetical protein N9D51_01360 [Actinomycetota bacterium]|jgi:hypothetical protein|nr:hypothetical protein [Actinomycetota bacterium]